MYGHDIRKEAFNLVERDCIVDCRSAQSVLRKTSDCEMFMDEGKSICGPSLQQLEAKRGHVVLALDEVLVIRNKPKVWTRQNAVARLPFLEGFPQLALIVEHLAHAVEGPCSTMRVWRIAVPDSHALLGTLAGLVGLSKNNARLANVVQGPCRPG